jgi:hypothetical protein
MSDWTTIPGVSIRTWQIHAGPAWHVRVHRVTTDHAIQLAEGGFAADEPTLKSKTVSSVVALGQDDGVSAIFDITGGRTEELVDIDPNSSLYYSRVQTPVLTASLAAGTHWIATAVFGAAPGSKASNDQVPKVMLVPGSKVTVESASQRVEIALEE